MTIRKAVLTAALLVSSPAAAFDLSELFAPAEAHQPVGRHRYRHARRHHVQSTPVAIEGSSPLIDVARRYIGSGNFTGLRAPWCRAFVNHVADRAGIPLANRSNRAIDALSLGPRVNNPRIGDLVVMRHHVTIFAGYSHGMVVGLGGNQRRMVRYSTYRPEKVVGFVRVRGT